MTASPVIAIIGSGPSGLGCALWLKALGCTPMLIERSALPGGSLATLNRKNRWILGFPEHTGQAIAERYLDHIRREKITLLSPAEIIAGRPTAHGFQLELKHQGEPRTLNAQALVIATGIRPKGAESLSGIKGLNLFDNDAGMAFHPLSHLEQEESLINRAVVVVGGGDNACYTAQDLVNAGAHVHLVTRSAIKAGAGIRNTLETLVDNGRITRHQPAQIKAIDRQYPNFLIRLDNGSEIIAERIFPRLGYTPNDAILTTLELEVDRDEKGFIRVDKRQQTSLARVYAIGDIASPWHQSVVNALAQGAAAAQAISEHA